MRVREDPHAVPALAQREADADEGVDVPMTAERDEQNVQEGSEGVPTKANNHSTDNRTALNLEVQQTCTPEKRRREELEEGFASPAHSTIDAAPASVAESIGAASAGAPIGSTYLRIRARSAGSENPAFSR